MGSFISNRVSNLVILKRREIRPGKEKSIGWARSGGRMSTRVKLVMVKGINPSMETFHSPGTASRHDTYLMASKTLWMKTSVGTLLVGSGTPPCP